MDVSLCERLWHDHADRLLIYATGILSNSAAAEDALQAVFARLIASESLPTFESEEAYLFRAVRNESLNALRSVRRAKAVRPVFFEASDPRIQAEQTELRKSVERTLNELPAEQREAVILKIWGDLSFPEAAAVTGESEKTIEHRYYRGLAALEEKLGKLQ